MLQWVIGETAPDCYRRFYAEEIKDVYPDARSSTYLSSHWMGIVNSELSKWNCLFQYNRIAATAELHFATDRDETFFILRWSY